MSIPEKSSFMQGLRKWRARLSPVIGIIVLGLFLYWVIIYWDIILSSIRKMGIAQLAVLILLILVSSILTVLALVILVRGKGYPSFGFVDGYHSLNLSQLAAMIPGGIWGFAGFAGYLWSRKISKVDSVIIIFLNTLIMLTACAIVGVSGLVSILDPVYIAICAIPFLFLLVGRDRLDALRQKYYPESSSLPSARTLLKVLFLGVVIWTITSLGFAWLLRGSDGTAVIPIWVIAGAYAAGYLGGYLAILVPSGLGVSEGIVTLILGPYIGAEKVLAVAVSFRIIHTFIVWCNILLSVLLTSRDSRTLKSP